MGGAFLIPFFITFLDDINICILSASSFLRSIKLVGAVVFLPRKRHVGKISEHKIRLAPLFSRRDGIDVDIGGPFVITVYSTISSYSHDLVKS